MLLQGPDAPSVQLVAIELAFQNYLDAYVSTDVVEKEGIELDWPHVQAIHHLLSNLSLHFELINTNLKTFYKFHPYVGL